MKSGRTLAVLRRWIIGFLFFPLLVSADLSAELIVIYDSGETRPLGPLLEVFAADEPPVPRADPHRSNLGASDLDRLLPISSPGLTPGKVERRHLDRRFARPFFLIGADPFSRHWLATHREELLRIGAVGMLVRAETVEDLSAIAVLAAGIPILPAPATDIAKALGLSRYPVLVSNQGIEQ
ncbi:MAG: integrating conjugative element protein [Pseudomonadota bacterium]|nr:integrating conjugative element protein [Pseudomonadota bacterium]